jgi:predicted methyltransferase
MTSAGHVHLFPVNVGAMKRFPLAFALFFGPLACASNPAPPPAPPAPPPAATLPEPAPASAQPAPAPPPEPSAEEKKQTEAAQKLAEERAKVDADAERELARWTPELHAQAKALAERKYGDVRSALDAALKSPHRAPGNAARDKARHPRETLEFFGLKPTQTVLEYGPGEGWYTEILAPVLAAKGKLLVNSADPQGPADARSTLYAHRLQRFLGKSPELFGKVEPIIVDPKDPKLDHEGQVDLVILARELHGMVNDGSLAHWLGEFQRALKPGGVLGIEQHRAKADANPEESAKKGYLPEKWVIQQIEAAGFKLAAKSEINANPKDTKDYEQGVWTLPPSFRLGDKDHDKYAAIGESDRMTLRFVKVAKK